MTLERYIELLRELVEKDPHIPLMEVKFPDDRGDLISMYSGARLKQDHKGEWYCSITGR